jgi:predicted permease
VLVGVAFLVVELFARIVKIDRATRAVLVLTIALGNTSFVGFPLCAVLLGDESVALALVYDQVGTILALTTVGLVVVARASGAEEPTPREIAWRVLVFPPFIALALAIVVRLLSGVASEPVLTFVEKLVPALTQIGDALVPIAMFAVGLRMRFTLPPERTAFAFGVVAKLAVMPLVAWGLVSMAGVSTDVANVAVLESAMPPMITAAALAAMAGLAPELASALVGWGIVASMMTLPAWALLLK